MRKRAITGFVFVATMFASLMFGAYVFTLVVLILSILALDEFYHLIRSATIKPQKVGGIALVIGIYLVLYRHLFKNESSENMLLCAPIVVAIIIFELYRKYASPFHNIAFTLFGVIYAVIPFCFFYALAFVSGTYNMHYPLAFLLLLWSSDTGAYLFGFKLGKHKLFERHSPKKTWEGLLGGVFMSALMAVGISFYLNELPMIHWLLVALIIVVVGTLGDLSESMLKRSLSVKDSGTLLPGHGGLLDRFDGLLLAAPIVFVYLHFAHRSL